MTPFPYQRAPDPSSEESSSVEDVSVSRKELEKLESRNVAFDRLKSDYVCLANDYNKLADDHHKLKRRHKFLEGDMDCLAGAHLAANEKATILERKEKRRRDREASQRRRREEHEHQAVDSDEEVAAPLLDYPPIFEAAPHTRLIKCKRAGALEDTVAMNRSQSSSGAMEEDDTGFVEESVATAEEVANSEKGEVQPRKKRKTRRRRDRAVPNVESEVQEQGVVKQDFP